MGKKAVVSLDLTAMVGSLQLQQPSHPLPQDNNQNLELAVANRFLAVVQHYSSHSFSPARTNPADPPDVLFDHDGEETGLELTELVPPNRRQKDAILQSVRSDILGELEIGPNTRNRVISISMANDYQERLRPKKLGSQIAKLLNDVLRDLDQDKHLVALPPTLQGVLSHVSVCHEDLAGDERIEQEDHPLLIFGAQHTLIVPDDDIPDMLETAFGRKLKHDLSGPTWLLVWNSHPAIGAVRDQIISQLRPCLSKPDIKYQHAFYLDLAHEGCMVHIPTQKQNRPLFDRDDK